MVSKTINLKDIREEAFEKGKAEGRKETAKAIFDELEKMEVRIGCNCSWSREFLEIKEKFLKDEKAEAKE